MYHTVKTNENKDIKGEDIAEVKMYEYSTVGYGANENTPLMDMKSFKDISQLVIEFEERLKKCNYSEAKGVYVSKIIKALKALEEPTEITLKSIFEPQNSTQQKQLSELLIDFKI